MEDSGYKLKILEYLKKNLKKGYTPESLKWALVKQGYSKSLVDELLGKAHKALAEEAPVFKEKPKIKYEIIDEKNNPIKIKRSWWRNFLGI